MKVGVQGCYISQPPNPSLWFKLYKFRFSDYLFVKSFILILHLGEHISSITFFCDVQTKITYTCTRIKFMISSPWTHMRLELSFCYLTVPGLSKDIQCHHIRIAYNWWNPRYWGTIFQILLRKVAQTIQTKSTNIKTEF